MNKNFILPACMDFFFPPLLCPKISPPPTYRLPPPPTYHLPTPPHLTPSPELQKCRARASLELEPGLLEQELGAWSCRSLELEVVRARELWLEPERDPHGTQVSIFIFFLVCLFCFSSLLCSCGATLQRNVVKKATAMLLLSPFFPS